MNRDQFAGKWHELKGKVKQKWGKLTDDDIAQVNGKWEQLSGKLQQKYGYAKEQAEREINSWCAACDQKKGQHMEDVSKKGMKMEGENRWEGRQEENQNRPSDQEKSKGNREEQRHKGQEQSHWHEGGQSKEHGKNHPDKGEPKDKKRKAG